MNNLLPVTGFTSNLFAPQKIGKLDKLFEDYAYERKAIEDTADTFSGEKFQTGLYYLLKDSIAKNKLAANTRLIPSTVDVALSYLDAKYWELALNLTDVYFHLPEIDRQKWRSDITERTNLPSFADHDTVKNTLRELLREREKFASKKVLGIFQALSKEHETNQPQGFNKTMILESCASRCSVDNKWIWLDESICGHIDDARNLVYKIMGSSQLAATCENSSYRLLMYLARNDRFGDWIGIDGGALEVKLFRKGTLHIRLHPEIAWQFNLLLHTACQNVLPKAIKKPNLKAHRPLVELAERMIDRNTQYLLMVLVNGYRPHHGNSLIHTSHVVDMTDQTIELLRGLGVASVEKDKHRIVITFAESIPFDTIHHMIETSLLPN